ncbi:MAG: hypothetical protein J6W06_12025 [Bacteroidales bacterium]|nr:hypothetical protein [Bacteroidales bacterium]
MNRLYALIILLSLCLGAFSQEITVRFTGQLNGTSYCRLDSVKVTNLTRDWTETVEYPDTIIVLGGTVGTDLNIAATQGLGQNIPNPFDCETRVELSVSQRENVRVQLLDASGKQYADYRGSLDAGVHTFDISAANPQTYILNAVVGDKSYSIRMVNMGSGCGSSIKYAGISGSITAKLITANEFHTGDNMRYVGYTTIGGQVVASDAKEQSQVVSQYVTLSFTHYSAPTVGTLAATNITSTSATLHGNISNNGGSAITSRGFYWGTAADNLSQVVLAGTGTGEYTADITGLSVATTYYYCAFATNNIGTSIGEVMSFETLSTTGALNGHEWVDLGLPSGLLWATTNVGAENPEEYGDYFAWGETTTKEIYDWSTYRYCDGRLSTLTKYCNNAESGNNGFTDNLTTLEASDDAATANWGAGWRMPTYDEMVELKDNCTVTWTTQNGVNGRLFTGPNGNSIFLPAAGIRYGSDLGNAGSFGRYWSSSLYTGYPDNARYLYFYSDNYNVSDFVRGSGFSVRPVCVNTSTGSLPTVITSEVSNLATNGATLNGNVISDGGATVISRGFYYGTNSNNLSQTVQSGSGTGSFTANLTDLASGTTYYYKAYATNSTGTAYGEVMSFTTENSGATTGTLNDHEWVDLGLPSGTRWATCNVGASTPTAYGNYYAWGETTTKETYTWDTYRYCDASSTNFLTNMPNMTKYTDSDNLTTLEATDDAATANWGSGWRMPTQTEMQELIDNCTVTWTTQNGVNGRLFTGTNGNSIFLPAAGSRNENGLYSADSYGNYWSSSIAGVIIIQGHACYLYFYSDACYMDCTGRRDYGRSVRPVYPNGSTSVTTGAATSITSTSATLNGNVTSDGGATVTERGFIYSTMSFLLNLGDGTTVQCGNGTGSFSYNLIDLTDGTTYYYKAYATNSAGTAYGEVMSFTTLGTPTVTTGSASSITNTSATLSGNVTSDGGATVTARGFLYGTSSSNLTQTVQSGSGTGSFTKSITGLSSYTTYYYKAYAANSAGTSYGEVMSFTTDVYPPTVITGTASNITTTSATISGNVTSDGGATVTERGFIYNTSGFFLNLVYGTTVQCGNGTGSFSYNLTDLSSGTTYYYKAYATNSEGTEYGEVMSFTTEVVTVGTLNGHEWIDLGLPSGIKWATCNVGATTSEAYGDYFAWGETSTKSTYTEDNYTYSSNPTTLPSSADAATANWGTGWRMPTQTEMQELIDNCTVTWTTQNGVNGRLFTGPNGNSIFLPAAGCRYDGALYGGGSGSSGFYWSRSLYTDTPIAAWSLVIGLGDSSNGMVPNERYEGYTVRAVCQPQN